MKYQARDIREKRLKPRPQVSRKVLLRGAALGLLGGALMVIFAMVRSSALGLGFWLPPKLIAGTYFGVAALLGNAGTIAIGLATHFAVAAACGALFTVLVSVHRRLLNSLLAALVYSVVLWGLMVFWVLPWLNPMLNARMAIDSPWFFVNHLVYAVSIAFAPLLAYPRDSHPADSLPRSQPAAAE